MNQDFKFYINYLNKDKDFFEETKFFKSYDDARNWAQKEFETFNPDMICSRLISM